MNSLGKPDHELATSDIEERRARSEDLVTEIAEQVNDIQGSTSESVTAIGTITTVIKSLSEIAAAISAAVEQQGAATNEISRSVQDAAKGTSEVSSNISTITRLAGETGTASSEVLSAASGLSQQSETLRLEVDKFLATVKAA